MRALNILFVTQNYPYPGVLHGGGRDIWSLIDFLRQRHTIYVLTFDDPVAPVAYSALQPYVECLKIIRYATTIRAKFRVALSAFARGYHHIHLHRREWEMQRLVRKWSEKYPIDVLYCGWTETGRYLTATNLPFVRVFDEVDVQYLVEYKAVEAGQQSLKSATKRSEEELSYCRAADLVITRSEADLRELQRSIPQLNGFVLPPVGNVIEFQKIRPEESQPDQVLFCGAMSRMQNEDAACWLVGEIWPLVRQSRPDAQLSIVGAYPSARVLELAHQPGVRVTGLVPDLRPFFAQARVVVAPTRVPAGNLNKIIDGLAAGRPVVATSIANRGNQASVVRVADSAPDFAAAIIELLTDSILWQRVVAQSRDYIADFNWTSRAMQLENLIQDLVSKRNQS